MRVLQPTAQGLEFIYHAYSCKDNSLLPRRAGQAPLYIIEGSYSLHPALRDCYDIKGVRLILTIRNRLTHPGGARAAGAERFLRNGSRWKTITLEAPAKCANHSDFLLSKNE